MNARIFKTSVACAALLCPVLLAGCTVYIPPDVRPEIAQPLERAENFAGHGDSADAKLQMEVAEGMPNQTAEEKRTVALVEARVAESQKGGPSNIYGPGCDMCDMAPNRTGFVDMNGNGQSQN